MIRSLSVESISAFLDFGGRHSMRMKLVLAFRAKARFFFFCSDVFLQGQTRRFLFAFCREFHCGFPGLGLGFVGIPIFRFIECGSHLFRHFWILRDPVEQIEIGLRILDESVVLAFL